MREWPIERRVKSTLMLAPPSRMVLLHIANVIRFSLQDRLHLTTRGWYPCLHPPQLLRRRFLRLHAYEAEWETKTSPYLPPLSQMTFSSFSYTSLNLNSVTVEKAA